MRTDSRLGIAAGAGFGAGLMFLLDPNMGGRRRAILRDKAISLARQTACAIDKTVRDTKNRMYGTVASAKSKFNGEEVSDDVLVERVRSKIGRAVSHPSAIAVSAQDGCVTLTGPVLSNELGRLVSCVSHVRGVQEVDNQLEAHDTPGDIPSLQGGRSRRGSQFTLLQSNWPPAIRLLIGSTSAAATIAGVKQRGIIGGIVSGIGAALTTMAFTNQGIRQLVDRASTTAEKRTPERQKEPQEERFEVGTGLRRVV